LRISQGYLFFPTVIQQCIRSLNQLNKTENEEKSIYVGQETKLFADDMIVFEKTSQKVKTKKTKNNQ
jgi:hypothetical protein